MDTPIKYIKGVGEKRALLYNKFGIFTLNDMLRFFPRYYLNFSSLIPIYKIVPNNICCFSAIVIYQPRKHIIRENMTLYKTAVTDGTATVNITIFNNTYLAESLSEGQQYIFYGKVILSKGSLEMSNPIVVSSDDEQTMRPIYSQSASLTSRLTEKIMQNALKLYLSKNLPDIIPDEIRREFNLCHEQFAIQSIHFPRSEQDLYTAKKRLVFEELLILQLGMKRLKNLNRRKTELTVTVDYTSEFINILPFELTNAQKKALEDCIRDMKSPHPMNRLIQGDVGSGKTAVAAGLIYTAAKNGLQCAFMAPTEILAKQHYRTLSSLLGSDNLTVELLTGSVTVKQKKAIKEQLKNGEINIIIGTHALLCDDVEFSNLGLVVTDEQHRFGVTQRGSLIFKGNNPHTLVMSATPIPRTLSLIIYGDLDLSVINELPKGRQKTDTFAVNSSYRERIYNFIEKHINLGKQAYIVCPAVEENEDYTLTSAVEYYEKLKKGRFSHLPIGLLHGKMKAKEKDKVMSDFINGNLKLLICTTVIEVGVDVPDSVIMVIEDADRFGLSQLHQLRGRVGRGSDKSYCILISDNENEQTKARLDIMCRTNDGFIIADEDLKIRGPGDFFGNRQHGLPDLRIADLRADMDTVRKSKIACDNILKKDPTLSQEQHIPLLLAVEGLFNDDKHLSFN